MTRQLTEAQRAYGNRGTESMRKSAVSRKQQIAASQRSFIYDGRVACGACGGPRGRSRGWKCKQCESGPS